MNEADCRVVGSERAGSKTVKPLCALILISMSLAALIAFQLPCRSQSLGKTYDYLFLIETEQVRDQFEYQNSIIGPIVKTKITYSQPDREDSEPVHYEDLWMHGWNVLGLRRMNDLNLQSGQIAFEVRHKSGFGSLQEAEAAAKAVLRLFVDLYARRHSVSVILVPDESMGYMLNQMPQAGFTPGPEAAPDVPVYSPIVIPIRTVSGSQKQVLYYTTPPSSGDDE
jgi:hypothetical protein